jgi:type II secretory pathway component GspD/PulD (secretin)
MKKSRKAWIACAALAAPLALALTLTVPDSALAQSASNATGGTPLVQLIETVSKKTGKNFVLDPRVAGNATLVGIDPSKVTYPELLTILQVNGYAAVESGGLVRVVPESAGRTMPSPLLDGSDKHPDAEIVTRVIRVKSVPATQLVPIMRSLLPQNAHLAAIPCTNELLLVDTYANVRRIESIVASMDKGDPLALPKCALSVPQAFQVAPAGTPPPAPAPAPPRD